MAESRLAQKLGIKSDQKILIMNAPEGYLTALGMLPASTEVKPDIEDGFEFVQVDVSNKADIDKHAETAIEALKHGGMLWFSYPKKTSKVKTDITRDIGWETLKDAGWRPVFQIAIDETWSALRLRPINEVKQRRKG